jgi:hypothetical protein
MPNERAAAPRALPYRKPTEGRDYWIVDDVLPDPLRVRERALARGLSRRINHEERRRRVR